MKKYINSIALFGLFTFYYLVMELAINDYAVIVIGEKYITNLYGTCYLLVGIGYSSYYFSRQILHNEKYRNALFVLCAFLTLISVIVTAFTNSSWAMLIFAYLAHLSAGYIGGLVYYNVAMQLKNTKRIGITIGIAYAGANLIQMIGLYATIYIKSNSILLLVDIVPMMLAVICIVFLILSSKIKNSNSKNLEFQTNTEETVSKGSFVVNYNIRKYVLGALIAIALMAFMHGLLDGIITTLHAQAGDYIAYSYPRLFVIPALLLAGLIADMKNRSIFFFSTLISMIITLIAVLLFYSPGTENIATCFVYFFGSFMSIFSVSIFMQIAQESSRPALIASAGRGVRYFFAGIAIILMGNIHETLSITLSIIIYVILVVGLFAVFFVMGMLQNQILENENKEIDLSKFNLTKRETEVLELIIKGKSTVEISKELYISERTVRSHISNLLAKTNSKTRVEMLANIK